MAGLLDSYSTSATTTPTFYTDYLSNLASQGTAAGNAALSPASSAAWNPNANQTAAFRDVGANVGNYQPGLSAAGQTLSTAAGTDISGAAQPYLKAGTTTGGLSQANPYLQQGTAGANTLVNSYMNPYTQNVVNQIGAANQQNIAQNLSPAITAGAVGSGQFGSQRGANALAQGISNADIGALTAQTQALQSGYTQALTAAQAQEQNALTAGSTAGQLQNQANQNQVAAGQIAGNTATQQGQLGVSAAQQQAAQAQQMQNQGLADTNALATIGQQQQTMAQAKALQPLSVLGQQAALMSGAQLPTTTTNTMTGSPLSAIAGLGATAAGLFSTPSTPAGGTPATSAGTNILNGIGNAGTSLANWYNNLGNNGTISTSPDTSSQYNPNAATSVDNSYTSGSAYDPNSYGAG